MKLIINNPSSDALSYVSGLVAVSAAGSLDVPSGLWERLYADAQFLIDLRNYNITVGDGASTYRYPESEEHVRDIINRLEFPSVRKDYSFTTAQTNTVLWTPTSGKKFVVTDHVINIRNSTLGAITLAIFDDTNATGNFLYKANFEAGTNYDNVANYIKPFISGALNRSLKITTSGNLTISGTLQGYETE